MLSFVALYRGPNLAEAELVGASSEPTLVAQVADGILVERERESGRMDDPPTAALVAGKRRALELVRDEALDDGGAGRQVPDAAPPGMARVRCRSLSVCRRCGGALPPPPKRPGRFQRVFCSDGCRAAYRREQQGAGGAEDAGTPPLKLIGIRSPTGGAA